jgi:hypothetical protein
MIADHEVVEHQSSKPYDPYDRLVLRNQRGRTISFGLLATLFFIGLNRNEIWEAYG